MSEGDTQLCYLCRREFPVDEITRDHVPPKCLFPEPRPNDLITVPCCEPCNNAQSKDDELLRTLTALPFYASGAGKKIFQEKVIESTIKKKRLKSEIGAMLAGYRDVLIEHNGIIQPGAKISHSMEPLRRIMTRITKGLLYRFYPDIDPTSLQFQVLQLKNDDIPLVLAELGNVTDVLSRGDGVFDARYGILRDSRISGVWLLQFYRATTFLVFHLDPDLAATNPELFADPT